MLANQSILIAEDEPLISISLAIQVEDLGGLVVGPAATVNAALALLGKDEVTAAILDVNLADRNVVPLAHLLGERRIPFVVHSAAALPEELARKWPLISLISKPAPPFSVVAHLLATIADN